MNELIILAHVPTDSVNNGFLPAARRLGLRVVLLTDQADAHRVHFARPGLAAYPDEIVACDVFNPLAVLGALTCRRQAPAALFSNSDHLQASAAMAADYLGLPGKDWHVAYRAKNKAEMRQRMGELGLDLLWHSVACSMADLAGLPDEVPFPCIVKPREGVASQQVTLAHDRAALLQQCTAVWQRQPGLPLLIEEYIEGPLYTLETLGDGRELRVLGGFTVTLSPPPYFVELHAQWGTGLAQEQEQAVARLIREFGVGFGACHTEFVMTARGPRLIEINYRNIGDYREFLMQDTLGIPLFETVLRLYLGEPLPALAIAPRAAAIRYFTAPSSGVLAAAPGGFVDETDGMRLAYQPLRAAGDTISLSHSNKDYLGVLRGTGPCRARLAAAMERVGGALTWGIHA